MDMLCKCGEPWDWGHIRDEVLRDNTLYNRIAKKGGYIGEVEDYKYIEIDAKEARQTESDHWQFIPGPYPIQCPACFGKDLPDHENYDIVSAMQDMLGEDIDGLMAELEDLGLT